MYLKLAKDASQVRQMTMQWDDKWKTMMSELEKDAKIPGLWRMSAPLDKMSERREGPDHDEAERYRLELCDIAHG